MHLVVMTTDRCNAACMHCSTDCGPRKSTSLSLTRAKKVMSDTAAVAAADEELDFCITGGEPFLDYQGLCELVAHSHALGATMLCVSNAYWASSEQRAEKMLGQLQLLGLTALAVSSSQFHEQFIKRSRVQRALRVAQSLGLETQLKFVSTRSDSAAGHPIVSWAKELGVDLVQTIPIMPTLRQGATLEDREYQRTEGLPSGACPAAVMTVRETGTAYTCCTPGAHHPLLALGHLDTEPLVAIRDRFVYGGLQRILREHGPVFLAEAARARGLGHRLHSAYGGVCDLCTHLLRDPALGQVVAESVANFEIHELQTVLRRAAPAMNQRH